MAHSALVLLGGLPLAACSSETPSSGASGGGAAGSSTGATSGVAGTGGAVTGGSSGSAGEASGGASAGSGGSGGGSAGSGGGGGGSAGSAGGEGLPEVSSDGDGKITIGPNYTKDPDLTDLGNPKGMSFQFSMKAAGSIFDGTDSTLTKPVTNADWSRSINVYVPAQYKDGDEAPILVIQEGQLQNVSRALDNLTISADPMKKLPAFIAIAVANGNGRDGSDGQGSERGLEYDTLSDRYTKFIDTEVLPAVLANAQIKAAYPNLKLTDDPNNRATMGCSSGGAAALTMGWFGGTFRRLITYSGTFVHQQNDTQPEHELYPDGAWDYHSELELIKNSEKKPLRIFLHASENDNGSDRDEASQHNWVMANERTAEDLEAKGYHYRFVYSLATGHCDGKAFDASLAEALSWVWRGYAP